MHVRDAIRNLQPDPPELFPEDLHGYRRNRRVKPGPNDIRRGAAPAVLEAVDRVAEGMQAS